MQKCSQIAVACKLKFEHISFFSIMALAFPVTLVPYEGLIAIAFGSLLARPLLGITIKLIFFPKKVLRVSTDSTVC